MGPLQRSRATLRIAGDELIPDEISHLLGCLPTSSRRKGEEISGKTSGQKHVAISGLWRLTASPREPEDLDGQIDEILIRLTDDLKVWKALSQRYSVDLFCGLFMGCGNEGLSLSARSSKLLGARGIELGLDIYGPDDPDDA
ncbi:hypothetical protein bAD24_p00060 (plasmid) [Burkholderia sp. AD24]|nr:hypothetical protein bAD24_p00060 [Burkholderia sp. AD24]